MRVTLDQYFTTLKNGPTVCQAKTVYTVLRFGRITSKYRKKLLIFIYHSVVTILLEILCRSDITLRQHESYYNYVVIAYK